jgi:hypothetical protein
MNRRVLLYAVVIGSLWWTCHRSREVGKVEVNFRVIRYTESVGFIELAWEPLQGIT